MKRTKIEKLPTYSRNKNKGNVAVDILKKTLDKFSIVNTIDESIDLGIDMRAQIIENEHPTPLFFNIQCKGKDFLSTSDTNKEFFSIQINVSTINYWLQQNDLTLLFVVDNQKEICYWCNPIEQLKNRINEVQSKESVTIHVSFLEKIDYSTKKCPDTLKRCIMLYMVNQLNKINDSINIIKDDLHMNQLLDVETSIYLIKNLYTGAQNIIHNYEEICKELIENIRKEFFEAYDYACELEYMNPVVLGKYCKNGVAQDKGFTYSCKSLNDLKIEANDLIDKFYKNYNTPQILDDLLQCDRDMEQALVNIEAFLYEISCDENSVGDRCRIYEKINSRKRRRENSKCRELI